MGRVAGRGQGSQTLKFVFKQGNALALGAQGCLPYNPETVVDNGRERLLLSAGCCSEKGGLFARRPAALASSP